MNIDSLVNFNNNNSYNAEMAKSAYDKLGFMDKIFEPLDLIVDFGCADGAITRMIKAFYPHAIVIGYDVREVLEQNGLYKQMDKNGVIYTSSLADIEIAIEEDKKSLLVMNSVMHEIFNYMSQQEYTELSNNLSTLKFDYIWIRDFYYDSPQSEHSFSLKSLEEFFDKSEEYKKAFMDFKVWNRLNNDSMTWRAMTHFLLKCRYKLNWNKECKEDYWAYVDNCQRVVVTLADGYDAVYDNKYVLPYVEHINWKDFGISLDTRGITTHRQTLWRRIEK